MITLLPVNILQFSFLAIALFCIFIIWHLPKVRSVIFLLLLAILSASFNLLEELNITRQWHLITPIFVIATGPVFYLFIKKLVNQESLWQWRDNLHLLPCLIALPFTHWVQSIIAIGTVNQIIYGVFTLKLIYRYHQAIYANRADADSLRIDWGILVLILFFVKGASDIVRLNLQPYISLEINLIGQFIHTAMSLLLVCFVVIKLLRKHTFFDDLIKYQTEEQCEKLKEDRHKTNSSIETILFEQIENTILTKELYKIPRLSLADLAKETGIIERDISRAINLGGGASFCDLINQLRIKQIKHTLENMISTSEQYTLLDVALAAGFNSKSSFNTVFKRLEGVSPTQYVKALSSGS